jgi:hypothetical protein
VAALSKRGATVEFKADSSSSDEEQTLNNEEEDELPVTDTSETSQNEPMPTSNTFYSPSKIDSRNIIEGKRRRRPPTALSWSIHKRGYNTSRLCR